MRQGLGVLINLAGLTLLTRIVSPGDYGLYVIAMGIVAFLTIFSSFGIHAYLVRSERDLPLESFQQALILVLAIGIFFLSVILIFMPPIVGWLGNDRLADPMNIIMPAMLVSLAALPSTAMIERKLDYRSIALMELSGQVSYFMIALTLAVLGFGVIALVMGYWAQVLIQLIVSYRFSHLRPKFVYSQELVKDMVGFGFKLSISSLIWQSRSLIIPILIGRYVGVEATAVVNLATRLVEALTSLRRVFWRLAVVAFAKIQSDLGSLQWAIEESMTLQVLATGPLLAGAGVVAPIVLPEVLGPDWTPALKVYPFVAIAVLFDVMFSMQSAALQVRRQLGSIAQFHLTHIALLSITCAVLLPRFGISGYAIAEFVALAGYLVLHFATHRTMSISYRRVFPWLVACTVPLFAVFLSFPWVPMLLIPTIAIVLLPPQLKQLVSYANLIHGTVVTRFIHRGAN